MENNEYIKPEISFVEVFSKISIADMSAFTEWNTDDENGDGGWGGAIGEDN